MNRAALACTAVTALSLLGLAAVVTAGPLNPPAGPIAPTNKTLTEVEPRIAINSTNTPGDTNSRFRITAPGSYYLTGNITGVSGDHGIEIAASNVTIDLMGFALTGIFLAADGITTDGVRDNITIRNGTITGWGSDGINLTTGGIGTGARIEGVTASGNGANGIRVGNRAILRSCMALENGGDGFNINSNAVMTECIASLNAARGFVVSSGSTLTACTASNNTTDGFSIVGNAAAMHCTAIGNEGRGFFVGIAGVVSQCIANGNGSHGIELTTRSVASNNTVHSNTNAGVTAAGIFTTGDSNKVQFNHCAANDIGVEVTGGTDTIVADNTAGDCTNNGPVFVWSGAGGSGSAQFYRNFGDRDGASPFSGVGLFVRIAPIADIGINNWASTPNGDHPWANFAH